MSRSTHAQTQDPGARLIDLPGWTIYPGMSENCSWTRWSTSCSPVLSSLTRMCVFPRMGKLELRGFRLFAVVVGCGVGSMWSVARLTVSAGWGIVAVA
jgi:hypothetical protein